MTQLFGRLVTVEEAAESLRISKETIRRWLREGSIPGAMKVGRQWRIDLDQLREHLHKGQEDRR
jgi:excisionase family DNA binding protein